MEINLEPIPTAETPASNHDFNESSVISTPPVGIIEVCGIGPKISLTKFGPPAAPPGKTLTNSTPNSCAFEISVADVHPGI